VRVVGIGHRRASLDEALEIGAIDAASLDPAEGVVGAALVVLCTPVGLFADLLRRIAPHLAEGAIVTDVGSTKAAVVRDAERILRKQRNFLGSHPIAGSEQRGVGFARADLFEGKTCILTPTARTRPDARQRVRRFWQDVGMRTVELSPAAHDRALARVSHLPHALAALLVNVPRGDELDLAGTGFIDTTRIAGGDPIMWRDICLDNRARLREAVDAMGRELAAFRRLLEAADGPGLERLFAKSQKRRADMLERRLEQRRIEG
ncbi:MAG: prephenate dehydrogenase, partial [Planctomycetes bacterium]|nr:prephenate dehydrogenase [Planctomycetota bacterium]